MEEKEFINNKIAVHNYRHWYSPYHPYLSRTFFLNLLLKSDIACWNAIVGTIYYRFKTSE